MFTKTKTPEALRSTTATLLDRARQAAADAITARSQASDNFAAGSDDAARPALTRAATLAAEAEALTQAAGETDARAMVADAEAQRAACVAKVATADKASTAARAALAREVPALTAALDRIAVSSQAAVVATAEAATAETAEPSDAPGPIAFSTPSIFAAGPISPRRLGQLVSAWFG